MNERTSLLSNSRTSLRSSRCSILEDELDVIATVGSMKTTGQASYCQTVMNLMKTCMGTGCLALSFACLSSGYVLYTIGIAAIALWNMCSVQRLCHCLELIPNELELPNTNHAGTSRGEDASSRLPPPGTSMLGEVAWYAFRYPGLIVLDVLMFLLFSGVIISYLCAAITFLADTPLSSGTAMDAFLAAFIIGCLSLVPDMGHLARASAVGLFLLLLTFVVIAVYGIVGAVNNGTFSENGEGVSIPMWPSSIAGVSQWFGVVAFGFGVVPLTYNYRNSMENPEDMVSATGTALGYTAALYILTGIALLALYPNLTGDLLSEIPENGIVPALTRLSMVFVTLTTAPLLVVPCGELLEGRLWPHEEPQQREQHVVMVRFGICATGVIIACAFPDFIKILSLVGSFCVSAVGFILPPLFHMKLLLLSSPSPSRNKVSVYGLDFCLLAWGVAATIIATIYTFGTVFEKQQ